MSPVNLWLAGLVSLWGAGGVAGYPPLGPKSACLRVNHRRLAHDTSIGSGSREARDWGSGGYPATSALTTCTFGGPPP